MITKFRIFLWIILIGVTCWLFYMKITPNGKISYIYDFKKPSRFINKLTPTDRVGSILKNTQKIIGDPVYFSLFTPRKFNKAKLILKYRRKEDKKDTECPIGHSVSIIPIIEAGMLVDKTIWRYDLQPIENAIINQLSLTWNVIENNGIILLQRKKKYYSIKEFLNNLPDKNEIALYNTHEINELNTHEMNELKTNKTKTETRGSLIPVPLRGAYQFYTYSQDEKLDFTFTFFDLNKNKNKDPIELNLYYNNKLVDSRHLDDDGIADDNEKISKEQEINFKALNLQKGIYKIELRVNDDIITKQITSLQKISFINKIWLHKQESDKDNLTIYTDSNELAATTIHPDCLQTIKIGEQNLKINETYKQFNSLITTSPVSEIKLQKSGIILAGNGVFTFSKNSLINPAFKKVDVNLDVNKVNYILAKYTMPTENNGWKTNIAEFDLTKAYQENKKYSFLISIPGLRPDDDINDWIEIKEIKVELTGKTLIEKLFN